MISAFTRIALLLLVLTAGLVRGADTPETGGVPISYQLPTDGPLPKTYRVTLAATDPKNPDWIVSTFAAGVVRTVTAENQGKFTENWDGLDENLMPVPPGEYGIKGIYMPAKTWRIDNEPHTIVPQLVSVASAFGPTREQDTKDMPFHGDPCSSPLRDVAVGPNGIGVFYYQYLENGTNAPMIDFKKPNGLDQVITAYGSGGAAGGLSVCTDGQTIWCYCKEGGPAFIHRADGKAFGKENAKYRRGVYLAKANITGMNAWRDEASKKTYLYVSQKEALNEITVLDGESAKELAHVQIQAPEGVTVREGVLYAIHPAGANWEIVEQKLASGLPTGEPKTKLALPAQIKPADIEVDSQGNFFLSDTKANKVYKISPEGKILLTIGKQDAQKSGSYDPETLMAPAKLGYWKDADGKDRILIIENDGPNRASEWSADGKMLREWLTLQTKANDGWTVDPEDPTHAYIGGQHGWLTRFKLDYEKGTWVVDAVWPHVGDGEDMEAGRLDHPKLINVKGKKYLACARSYNIYRLDGDKWVKSAGIITEREKKKAGQRFLWSDTNGDGEVQEDEYKNNPLTMPGHVLRYWGETWINDLSLVAMNQAGQEVWRLAPAGFDERGNPTWNGSKFEKLFTDSVLEARVNGTADALHGGNELANTFSSDWAMVDGSMEEGFYVNSRGGPNFSANEGAQIKVSRYVPDGKGGFTQKWRVGRTPLRGLAQNGEIYGSIFITKPMGGIVAVTDNSRAGLILYTEDGLFVESVFPDSRRFGKAGIYPQPGEFFAGFPYANKNDGKIYIAMGKYTPVIFEAEGWTLSENNVRRLTKLDERITITASQISPPPPQVGALKGGVSSRVAVFAPVPGGGPALDGSLNGWDACEALQFQSDKDQSVEVRCAYDPEHLYIRWHARLNSAFEPKALFPFDRIFTHDRQSDTLSLYLQCDANAKPGGPAEGRSGDLRIVFGIFKDGETLKPVALGLYPKMNGATGAGKNAPLTYGSPVGKASFEHVGLIESAKLGHTLDADKKGFVIAASIPRSALPLAPELSGKLRTQVNFEATYGGHNKFWWANANGSANRETYDEPTEARLYPGCWAQAQFGTRNDQLSVRAWQTVGPFGGPEAKAFHDNTKKEIVDYFNKEKFKLDDDHKVNLKEEFGGPQTITNKGGPTKLRWQMEMPKSDEDFINLGHAGQLFYAANWIYAPNDMKLDCTFILSHPQNYAHFFVGEQDFPVDSNKGDKSQRYRTAVQFKKGWNQVLYRGFCVGYASRCGLLVHGTPEQLWTLKFSSTPQE